MSAVPRRSTASRAPAALAALVMLGALVAGSPARGAPAAQRCTPAALSATLFGEGATQSLLGEVTITNHARVACALAGRPAITVAGGSPHGRLRQAALATAQMFPGTRFAHTVVLDAGRSASVRFQWSNWCVPHAPAGTPPGSAAGGGGRPTAILVSIAPHAHAVAARVRGGLTALALPVCAGPGSPLSTMSVSLWIAAP